MFIDPHCTVPLIESMNESANPTLLFEIVFRHEITVSDNAILLEGQTLVFTKRTQIRVRAEVVSIASQSGRAPKVLGDNPAIIFAVLAYEIEAVDSF